MMRFPLARAFQAGVVAVALSACAAYGPASLAPGTPAADVRSGMGAPTGTYARDDGGQRVEYAKGPYGLHTFMLDFDRDGRLLRSQQVLSRVNFGELRTGMTRDEVLYRIGQPSQTKPLPRQNHALWIYRFDSRPFCEWFMVSMDSGGRVADTGYGPDPMCTPQD